MLSNSRAEGDKITHFSERLATSGLVPWDPSHTHICSLFATYWEIAVCVDDILPLIEGSSSKSGFVNLWAKLMQMLTRPFARVRPLAQIQALRSSVPLAVRLQRRWLTQEEIDDPNMVRPCIILKLLGRVMTVVVQRMEATSTHPESLANTAIHMATGGTSKNVGTTANLSTRTMTF